MDLNNETPSDTQDDTFTESDFEEQLQEERTRINVRQNSMRSVDYWFGCIYLRSVVAQKLLTKPNLQTSFPVMESRLNNELQNFPYSKKLREFWREGIDIDSKVELEKKSSPQIRYLEVIGDVMRSDDPDRRQILLQSLQNYAVDGAVKGDSRNDPPEEAPSQKTQSSSSTPTDVPDHVFTTTLYEHASHEGWCIKHSERRVYDEALAYWSIMKVGNDKFIGRGRSKDQAKHAASRKACKHFGLLGHPDEDQ